jgi:hypothetical protein
VTKENTFEDIKEKFDTGVHDLREFEKELLTWTEERHIANHEETKRCVVLLVNQRRTNTMEFSASSIGRADRS